MKKAKGAKPSKRISRKNKRKSRRKEKGIEETSGKRTR